MFCCLHSIGQFQSADYSSQIKKADSLYHAKDYLNSAKAYSQAFLMNDGKAYAKDRYNAACSWALANYKDSAFYHLNRLEIIDHYSNHKHIATDTNLVSLHADKRWNPLLSRISRNKEKSEAKFNRTLAKQLDSIYASDQTFRLRMDSVGKKHGWDSKEMHALWKTIAENDSINRIKVTGILDKYGWLGQDIISEQGNTALFLVIQHADQKTQEKYLPMMRDAVRKGNAKGSHLALLEDRVALRQGKKQIYGSQVSRDEITQTFYLLPLIDPDNVDKRRAAVGLPPLADYLSYWNMKWDIEEYKKALPKIEEMEKKKNQ